MLRGGSDVGVWPAARMRTSYAHMHEPEAVTDARLSVGALAGAVTHSQSTLREQEGP
jgi:hypothetical protein